MQDVNRKEVLKSRHNTSTEGRNSSSMSFSNNCATSNSPALWALSLGFKGNRMLVPFA